MGPASHKGGPIVGGPWKIPLLKFFRLFIHLGLVHYISSNVAIYWMNMIPVFPEWWVTNLFVEPEEHAHKWLTYPARKAAPNQPPPKGFSKQKSSLTVMAVGVFWARCGTCWEHSSSKEFDHAKFTCKSHPKTGWWFQPIWKICSSKW